MILRSRWHAATRNRRGAAAVEFALVVPIFFLVVLGIIEFGRATMVQANLVNAAREGARAATLQGETDQQVTQTVTNYLSGCGITGSTVQNSPSLSSSPVSGTLLTVSVNVPFNKVSWLGSPFWLKNQSLSASVVMRKE